MLKKDEVDSKCLNCPSQYDEWEAIIEDNSYLYLFENMLLQFKSFFSVFSLTLTRKTVFTLRFTVLALETYAFTFITALSLS